MHAADAIMAPRRSGDGRSKVFGPVRRVRVFFSSLARRQDVKEHWDFMRGLTLVLVGHFMPLVNIEASLDEGLHVDL
jgi:hypothetical protein